MTERIPRPEEVIGEQLVEDLTLEQIPQPLPCGAGRGTDNLCPRPATSWIARELPKSSYSWFEDCLERLEGKELRQEYYARLA